MSDRLDITRRGVRSYTPGQAALLAETLRAFHVGAGQRVTMATLARALRLDGRILRAALRDLDGVEFVIAGGDDGLYIATATEEAEQFTWRLMRTATSLQSRGRRRIQWTNEHLTPHEPELF